MRMLRNVTDGGEGVITPAPAVINIDPAAPKAVASATPAPAPPAPAGEPTDKPSWLEARLERERKQFLKELGIDSLDAGKQAVAAAKKAADDAKSDAEKAAEAKTALEKANAENKRLSDGVSEYAKSLMGGLTDAQKASVAEIAGEDAALQIKTINAMRPSWGAPAPTADPAAKQIVANTAVTKPAPKDQGNPGGAPDPQALYEANKHTNPIFWARFAEQHGLLLTPKSA